MFCCACGASLWEHSRFCGCCGAEVAPGADSRNGSVRETAPAYPDLVESRFPGEETAFRIWLGVLAALGLVLFALSAGLAFLAAIAGLLYVKIREAWLLGRAVPITARNRAEVHELLQTACERLGLHRPRAYVLPDPTSAPCSMGISAPFAIVLPSRLEQALERDELLYVLGREAAHIQAGHTRWFSLMAPLARRLPGFRSLFGWWRRKAEYTADRGGLLACRKIDAAVRGLLKMSEAPGAAQHAGVDLARSRIANADPPGLEALGEMLRTPPGLTRRIRELILFDRAHRITPAPDPGGAVRFGHCPVCGKAVRERANAFCSLCGARLPEWDTIPPAAEAAEDSASATRQRART